MGVVTERIQIYDPKNDYGSCNNYTNSDVTVEGSTEQPTKSHQKTIDVVKGKFSFLRFSKDVEKIKDAHDPIAN